MEAHAAAQQPLNTQRKDVHSLVSDATTRQERSGSITDQILQSAQGLLTKISIPVNSQESNQGDSSFLLEFVQNGGAYTSPNAQNSVRRASDPTDIERTRMSTMTTDDSKQTPPSPNP